MESIKNRTSIRKYAEKEVSEELLNRLLEEAANTITGMKIDIHRRKFAIANKTGGMSGPAIKPIAVRMVYQVAQAVKIPIIGMGGIATAEDAIEFILAGASAVSVGAMNFVDPYTTVKVVEGIEDYMRTYHVENLTDLIGAVE